MGCKLDVIATAFEEAPLAELPSEAAMVEAVLELLLQLVVNVAVAFCDSSPAAVF